MTKHIAKTLKEFPDYTSIHGIGGVTRGKYVIQKVFWILAFCVSFGMCIFQVYRLGNQFTREQTTTKFSVQYGTQDFPVIRLCNLNPMKYSEVKKEPFLLQIIEEAAKSLKFDPYEDAFSIPQNVTYGTNFSIDGTPLVNAKYYFRMRMGELGDEELQEKSQNISDFLIDCSYQGDMCDFSKISIERDEYYGICYKFKMDDKVYKTGPQDGILLILNVRETDNIPFITESSGVVVDVSSPGKSTSLRANGMSLPTGFEINMGLSVTQNTRIPGRNEKCSSNSNMDIALCMELCLGHLAAKYCMCTDDYRFRASTGNADFFCKDNEDFDCLKEISNNADVQVVCPHCKILCSREDLLVLRIYYASLSTTVIEEELAYTIENFVSDIGGQLGLWAGLSVLSLAEVIELIVLLIITCIKGRKTQDK